MQIRKRSLHKQFIDQCHEKEIKVFYFYADEVDEMTSCIQLGVDGILTNYPNILRDLMENY